ncbi:MAG: RNA polymerase Rpb4 family protein [Candidatus Aenigmatarchaeota archaeon]
MKIIEDKLVSAVEAKVLLKDREKEQELGYEQKNAFEALNRHSKLTPKKASEMEGELRKITRLRDRHITAIMDHMPKDLDDLRVLFAGDVVSLQEDDKKAVLNVVKKFL